MSVVSIIGIIFAILNIIYLCIKGFDIIFVAPLATIIVLLTNDINVMDGMLYSNYSYMHYLTEFIKSYFFIFFLGSLLGKMMEKSNSTVSIANHILRLTGKDNPYIVLVGIVIISSIFTYGGISIFVVLFTIIPMVKPIFKDLNINWALVGIPVMLGSSTYTMSMLPGSPSIQNTIPINILGTNLIAAPAIGIIAAVSALAFGLIYMHYQVKKSIRNGENFHSFDKTFNSNVKIENIKHIEHSDELPSLWKSILPIIVLIVTIMSFSSVENIIITALIMANISCALLHKNELEWYYFPLNTAAKESVIAVFATASSIAFGSTLTNSQGFQMMQNSFLDIPISPEIKLAVLAMILTFVTASASGSIGIIMNNYAAYFLKAGLSPEIIHRISVIASGVTTSLPHGGVVITFNKLTGLRLKDSYKHILITVGGAHLTALIVSMIYIRLVQLYG